jgi:hypothetical protein
MKIRAVGAEFFYADGQTDRLDEANSCLSQFCERALKLVERVCGLWKLYSLLERWREQAASILQASRAGRVASYKEGAKKQVMGESQIDSLLP